MPGVYRRRFCDILFLLGLSPAKDTIRARDASFPARTDTTVNLQDAALRSPWSARAASTRENAATTVFSHPANISVTRRREMGDDIEGACGQLRRKTLQQAQGREG